VRTFTYAERPDLAARTGEIADTFAPFLGEGEIAKRHWHKLREELPELQLVLSDEERDRVVGHARTIPVSTAGGLPGGVDDALEAWFGDGTRPEPDVLSAMVAVVDRDHEGQGLSAVLIAGMTHLARRNEFPALVAPVRPNWKDRYPLIPMERYVRWTRDDGLPFDPWLRVHARLGGTARGLRSVDDDRGKHRGVEGVDRTRVPGRRRLPRPRRPRPRPRRERPRLVRRAQCLDAPPGHLSGVS
jgi:hypothetical protein